MPVFVLNIKHLSKYPGQTIDKTSNRFAHKKGSIASRINEDLTKRNHSSPEKKRKKGSSSLSDARKASSERSLISDSDAKRYRDKSINSKDRYDHEQEEDDSEDENDLRRKNSRRSPDNRRESKSTGFYDDGYEVRRYDHHDPSWERREQQGSYVKNSLDNSLYLSPRNTNLNDSFTSSRPSRLESIPEAG